MPLATPRPGARVTSHDGTELATWELGGHGPLVLLTHGTGLSAAMWLGVAPHLAALGRCVALDMRGHGASGPSPTRRYDDWPAAGADVLAVLDALDPDGPVLGVGHSFGAASLLLAEEARPGAFAALWCYEPIVVPPTDGVEAGGPSLADAARRRRNRFTSAEAAVERFSSKPPFATWAPGLVEAYVRSATRPDPTPEEPEAITLVLPGDEEATCYEGAPTSGAWGALGSVGAQVTVAAAAAPGGPADWAGAIAGRLPHATLRRFEGIGHFGPLEDPDAVGAAAAHDLRTGVAPSVAPPR